MDGLVHPDFWLSLGQIILIDLLLGGDNAVVIALACRNLPDHLRRRGIFWGTVGAIALRVALISFALTLLTVPYLKLVGAALLFWIGIKLMLPDQGGHETIPASARLLGAVRTIVVADFIMSVDNIIGIAGVAQSASHTGHDLTLVVLGLMVSVPIIVWGSTMVIKLMDRFSFVITLGAMLLGWIAGTLLVGDPALSPYIDTSSQPLRYQAGGVGAVLVFVVGRWVARRRMALPPADAPSDPRQHP